MFDWRIGIFAVQSITTLVTLTTFFIIKFNDIKHISKYINEIKDSIKSIDTKVDNLTERIAKIEGQLTK